MRLFLALPVDQTLALDIARWRDQMFSPLDRWVPVANYHVTLAFIGALKPAHYEALCEQCDRAISSFTGVGRFDLALNQTGYWSKPQILWLGPEQWSTSINQLREELLNALTPLGIKKDKKAFQPHVTLARHCQLPARPIMEADFTLSPDRVVLYESCQIRSGVVYQERESWPLFH